MLPYLFLLTLVGGVIAYIGDRVGRSVGKKRLSIFNLRPKRTSVIVTIVTGFLIALCSTLFLFFLSAEFREAVLEWDNVKRDLARTERELSEKDKKLQESHSKLKEMESRQAQQASELKRLQADIEDWEEKSKKLSEELAAQRKERETLVVELDDLDKETVRLQAQRRELVAQNQSLQKQKKDLNAELTETREDLSENQRIAMHEPLIFNAGEPLIRMHVPDNFSSEELKAHLTQTVEAIYALAESKGAKIGFGLESSFFQQQMDGILEKMAMGVPLDWVIDIQSAGNVFKGEPITLAFVPRPDIVMFHQGDVLDKVKISGAYSREEIRAALFEGMDRAAEKVREMGISQDPQTGKYTAITNRALVDWIDRLEARKRDSVALLLAKQDTRLSETPVQVEMEIAE